MEECHIIFSNINSIFTAAPESELAKTKRCYRSSALNVVEPTKEENDINEFLEMIFTEGEYIKKFVPLMEKHLKNNLTIRNLFSATVQKSVIEAISICADTISQNSPLWFMERKIRITASIAYGLYTFSSTCDEVWKKKIKQTYQSFGGNEATKYGLSAEKRLKLNTASCIYFLSVD